MLLAFNQNDINFFLWKDLHPLTVTCWIITPMNLTLIAKATPMKGEKTPIKSPMLTWISHYTQPNSETHV